MSKAIALTGIGAILLISGALYYFAFFSENCKTYDSSSDMWRVECRTETYYLDK